jgi:glutathione synthase/RimK-type ligase-like ATP-grasp enzyme
VSVLIVVDNPKRWPLELSGADVVSARDYLTEPRFQSMKGAKVFNLCRSYAYQQFGYYVSLLATARGHRPMPSVSTVQDMKLQSVVRLASQEFDDQIQKCLGPLKSDAFELSVYFGRNLAERYASLSLALFNAFPAPFLRASFEKKAGDWTLTAVRIIAATDIPDDHRPFVLEQAKRYFARPRRASTKKTTRYDLAILVNEQETTPPSDEKAIRKFTSAAEDLGFAVETISKEDYGRIGEFDALFIRETTAVNHHTYRFARRATAEGLVVIDDPESILRCTNKVFLAELLNRHGLAMPRTVIITQETAPLVAQHIGFPCILKLPDGSFSQGVKKYETLAEFEAAVPALFEQSDLLVAQEFCPTEFDWRIGVLDGRPLYACRYHMARKHWQIISREGGEESFGSVDTISIDDTPLDVLALGVRAASLIGKGFYGVDIKEVRGRPVVIEINDNPSVDAGYEDRVLKDELYERVMRSFLDRLEARRWQV